MGKESNCNSWSCCGGAGSIHCLAHWVMEGSSIAAAVAQVTAVTQIQSLVWELPHDTDVTVCVCVCVCVYVCVITTKAKYKHPRSSLVVQWVKDLTL